MNKNLLVVVSLEPHSLEHSQNTKWEVLVQACNHCSFSGSVMASLIT